MGYLKPAPGSWGSLAAAVVWWFLAPEALAVQISIVMLAFGAGTWSAAKLEQLSGGRDPAIVVIDEVAGMWCALLMAEPSLWYYGAAYILFRFMDIFKPGPVGRLEDLPGGWGVMMDDVAAGLITLAVVRAGAAIL